MNEVPQWYEIGTLKYLLFGNDNFKQTIHSMYEYDLSSDESAFKFEVIGTSE